MSSTHYTSTKSKSVLITMSELEMGRDEEGLNTIYIKEEITYATSDEECSNWPANIQRTDTTEGSTDPLLQNKDRTSASNECHTKRELLSTDLLAVEMPSLNEREEETCGESNASVQSGNTASEPMNDGDISSVSATKHNIEQQSVQCEFCNKSFSQMSKFNRHLKTHILEKTFQCEFCDKRFLRKSHLIEHIMIHTGVKPFQCEFCDKSFSQTGSLNRHIMTHTGEKPFQCELCNRCFSLKSHLNDHIRTHTNEKPFQCEFCGKNYSHKGRLKDHIRTHTGKKAKVS